MFQLLLQIILVGNIVAFQLQHDGETYHFGTQLVDYDEARNRCSAMNGFQLVAIYNNGIQEFLENTIRSLPGTNLF